MLDYLPEPLHQSSSRPTLSARYVMIRSGWDVWTDEQAPALELDGKMIAESGFITHKLMTAFPAQSVEKEASDDSIFWSHFSEGSLMTQLQLGISVMITTGAVASGQMPGVEMSEEGRKAVGQYGKVLMVSQR